MRCPRLLVVILLALCWTGFSPCRANVGDWTQAELENSVFLVINVNSEEGSVQQGTAFAVGRDGMDIYLATAAHVSQNAHQLFVITVPRANAIFQALLKKQLPNPAWSPWTAEQIAVGRGYKNLENSAARDRRDACEGEDIALLKMTVNTYGEAEMIRIFAIAPPEVIEQSDSLYCIGFPEGIGRAILDRHSNEIINLNTIQTNINSITNGNGGDYKVIEANRASITHGSSGGPAVMAKNGMVAGVVSQVDDLRAYLAHSQGLIELLDSNNVPNRLTAGAAYASDESDDPSADVQTYVGTQSNADEADEEAEAYHPIEDGAASSPSPSKSHIVLIGVGVLLAAIVIIMLMMLFKNSHSSDDDDSGY